MLGCPRALTGWRREGLALVLLGLLAGCHEPAVPPTGLSPPAALVTQDPWQEAELVAARVPASSTVIGHGRSMDPLYPEGTVLVLQRLRWENMRAGMTTIYNKDPDNPYHMVAHVLLKREEDEWTTQGLANTTPDQVRVTADNYIGTVVAAFRRETPLEALFIITRLPTYQSGTCLMRCHLDLVEKKTAATGRPRRQSAAPLRTSPEVNGGSVFRHPGQSGFTSWPR